MDIVTAFKYRACGYRVRRAAWVWMFYIDTHNHSHIKLLAEDVLADDWEIVKTGIRSDFGRIEYEDED
jgi:hypothetical protein